MYTMYQMKTVKSTILGKTKLKTLGSQEDINISMQITVKI